jgi:hypothetical protein
VKKAKCAPGCEKPCCSGAKKVKRVKKAKCAPGCDKPCCSGEDVSEIKVVVGDDDCIWVDDDGHAEHVTLHAGHGDIEDVYVMHAGVGGVDEPAECTAKKIRVTRDGENVHVEEIDTEGDESMAWQSEDAGGAWLGVYLQDLDDDLREAFDLPEDLHGALVTDVVRSGPARKAGVRKGFVVVEYDGNPVESADELIKMVKMSEPGDRVELVLNRHGQEVTRRVTLGKKPQERVVLRKSPQEEDFEWHGELDDDEDILIEIPDSDVHTPHMEFYELHEGGGYLGVGIANYDDEGVLVEEVFDGTPADEYGIEEGDVIYRVDGEEVEDTEQLIEEIRAREPGDVVVVHLERDGDPMKLKVKVGERAMPRTVKIMAPRSSEMKAEQLEREIQELQQELKELKKQLAKLKEQ